MLVGSPESRETITDVTGSKGAWHLCTHDKRRGGDEVTPIGAVFTYTNTSFPFGSAVVNVPSTAAYYASNRDEHLPVPDGTLVARSRVPAISRNRMEGLVSLYELKDLHQTLGSVAARILEARARALNSSNPKRSLGYFADSVREDFQSGPGRFLSSVVGLHLAWKFGIEPLIRDVNNVYSALGRVDADLKRLEKPFAVSGTHTETKVDPTYVKYNWVTGNGDLALYQTYMTINKQTKVVFRQGALRQFTPNAFLRPDTVRLNAIREQLGLKPSLKGLWNILPRSFVLDFFFPISNFLAQADGFTPDPQFVTTLHTWSTTKSTTDVHILEAVRPIESSTSSTRVDGNTVSVIPFQRNTYVRGELGSSSWEPSQIYVPEPRLPSGSQWATVAEMLVQSFTRTSHVRRSRWY